MHHEITNQSLTTTTDACVWCAVTDLKKRTLRHAMNSDEQPANPEVKTDIIYIHNLAPHPSHPIPHTPSLTPHPSHPITHTPCPSAFLFSCRVGSLVI